MTIHVQISTVKCMQFLHLKKKILNQYLGENFVLPMARG